MALGTRVHIEVRTSGDDTAGGGFNPASAGFSNTLSGLSCDTSSPRVFSSVYSFNTGDIGAYVHIQLTGTTNSWIPGAYPISNVTGTHAILSAPISGCVLYNPSSPYYRYNQTAGCATVASPVSGTFGIDYSQSTGIRIRFTDMLIGAAGASQSQFTSVANPVGKHMIGNIINVTGGSGWTVQRVEITTTSGTTPATGNVATCVMPGSNLGSANSGNGVGNLGGPLSSLGAAGWRISGHRIFLKYGTYPITSVTANVSSGTFTLPSQSASADTCELIGYQNLRYDNGSKPLLIVNSGLTGLTVLTNSTSTLIDNIEIDCSGVSSCKAISTVGGIVSRCRVKRATNGAFVGAGRANLCEATQCSSANVFDSLVTCYGSWAHDNSVKGFMSCINVVNCISSFNTGSTAVHGFDGAALTSATNVFGSLSVGNAGDGFKKSQTNSALGDSWINNIAYSNGGTGFNFAALYDQVFMQNCAIGANGKDINNPDWYNIVDMKLLTANPFTNTGTNDFSLNTVSGGGALLRGAGYPARFPSDIITNNQDIGPVQHADSGVSVGTTTILVQRRRNIV